MFEIDLKNGIPIYIQLKREIKYAIATGKLPPGSQLPTVRQLAVDLKVNVNTIRRVYSELKKEGVFQPSREEELLSSKRRVVPYLSETINAWINLLIACLLKLLSWDMI